jgi:hypothetical protein
LSRQIREQFRDPEFEEAGETAKARAAYLAMSLDLAPAFKEIAPLRWAAALAALQRRENVVQAVYFQADVPAGAALQAKATAAGLKRPAKAKPLW